MIEVTRDSPTHASTLLIVGKSLLVLQNNEERYHHTTANIEAKQTTNELSMRWCGDDTRNIYLHPLHDFMASTCGYAIVAQNQPRFHARHLHRTCGAAARRFSLTFRNSTPLTWEVRAAFLLANICRAGGNESGSLQA